ncbi:hypothetical protein M8845_05855, partial [Gelidibacter japonicus]|uniref:hypothetical protein n=1 Tax=Gelidibacter japonicus TaxID=1962232 RepID=UPI002021C8FC
MRKFLKATLLVVFSYISIVSSTYGQNTAHKGWDLLDKPVRRAHWVWTNFATEPEAVQDAYLNFCRNKSINEVYMFIAEYYWYPNSTYEIPNQEALAQFIAKANNFGIKI